MSKPTFVIGDGIMGLDELVPEREARSLIGAMPVYRGVWNPDSLYNANDSVTYPDERSAFYVARRNLAGERPDDAGAWEQRGVAVE